MKVAFASTIAKKDFVINSEDLWNVIALRISRMGIKKFLKKARTIWETSNKKRKKD